MKKLLIAGAALAVSYTHLDVYKRQAIINAIDSCRVMVLIFSLSANASRQVPREIERAVSKGVPIVPIRIEEVAPTESMAYFLDSVHWLDALTPPLQKHLEFLVDSVRSFLAVPLIDTSAHAPDVAAEAAMSQARDRAGQHDAESKAATKRLDNSKGDVLSLIHISLPDRRNFQ